MALISAGKSNGILDPSCFLSSLFLSRIVKWSFWLVTKLNAAENHRGTHADVNPCTYIAKPSVLTLMEFVELPGYILKLGLSRSFEKEKNVLFTPNAFSLPIASSTMLVKMRILTQYAFLGKDTSMLKNMNQNIKRQIIWSFFNS